MKTVRSFFRSLVWVSHLRFTALTFFLSVFTTAVFSQEKIDTVEYARQLTYSKNFSEAEQILRFYTHTHSDPDAMLLHAQVLYWMQHFDRAGIVYRQALSAFPGSASIQLDFGRFLYETGRYRLSEKLLHDVLLQDSTNLEVRTMLAYLSLWKGRPKDAAMHAEFITRQYPGNESAINILKQVKVFTAPYIHFASAIYSDDQPLSGHIQELETGWYRSSAFAPVLSMKLMNNQAPDEAFVSSWLQVSNNFSFDYGKTNLRLKVGTFIQDAGEFTGAVHVRQKLGKFSVEGNGERRPYQYTMASVRQMLMQDFFSVALNFNAKDKWLCRVAREFQKFEDGNNIHTSYIWLLMPLVNGKKLQLKTGYAFNYSTSDENRFQPTKDLKDISAPVYAGQQIQGIYKPYFTPQNQTVHSWLANLSYTPSSAFSLSMRSSWGVHAKADNPLLIVKANSSDFYVVKTFSAMQYQPIELTADVNFSLSRKLSLKTTYSYRQLLFYTQRAGQLQLKYLFL